VTTVSSYRLAARPRTGPSLALRNNPDLVAVRAQRGIAQGQFSRIGGGTDSASINADERRAIPAEAGDARFEGKSIPAFRGWDYLA
jgi:hypothetical protein